MINIDSTLKYTYLWKIKIKKYGQFQFQIKNPKTRLAFRYFSKLFSLISTVPLSVHSEVINSSYLKIIPLIRNPENVWKTEN